MKNIKHFDVHNLYAHMQLKPTYKAAKLIKNDARGFVLTRSTFLGSGKYGGHWTGVKLEFFSLIRNLFSNLNYYIMMFFFQINAFRIINQ